MALSQHAFQPTLNLPQHPTFESSHFNIDLKHVSVSQLLGRDYVFINTQEFKLPLKNPLAVQSLLNDLILQLGLEQTHTVALTVDESSHGELRFTRHDLTWFKHKVCRVESVAITHNEQHEFMSMIWRCSTELTSA